MAVQPNTHPLPGPLLPPPMAPPPPVVTGSARSGSDVPAARARGASRTARAVLSLSVLVAVAGVSFSVGRLTAGETQAGVPAPFAAGAGVIGGVDRAPGGEASATETSVGGTTASDSEITAADEALTVAESSADDSAVSVSELTTATDQAAAAGPAVGAPQPRDGAIGGPPGGAGRGGIEGTVTELTDSTLLVTLDDGSTQSVAIDTSTAWVEQQAISAADVAPGDTVSVQLPFGGPGASQDEETTVVATQVTVTDPAS